MEIPPWNQPSPPNLGVSALVATLLAGLGGILLAGLPGFGFLALADVIGKPLGFAVEKRLGSSLWGAAILISMAWPVAHVAINFLIHYRSPRMTWGNRFLLSFLGSLLFGLAAAFFFALIAW
ncbi:MAG: hypothetical protein R3325_00375 [Thermoanaerobaculia bacterium]|nr:hypothetical protein [Thermoanaerobaculia bacterium]